MRFAFFCYAFLLAFGLLGLAPAQARIGDRFPSEKKVVIDPTTGVSLAFLTSEARGDSKIYQTHRQWTSDGQWLVFRSRRVPGQAMAVNEATGEIVQVTEGGYSGMLCVAAHSMNLYVMRFVDEAAEGESKAAQIVCVDLAKLFADSALGAVGPTGDYEQVCGVIPPEYGAVADIALDADERTLYFRVGAKDFAAKYLASDTLIEPSYGPRNMGAGPTGIGRVDLRTGEVSVVIAVPFQIGHIQTNPWVSGELVFCWETGGKAPQRTWFVRGDGTGLRPLYPEAETEWVTHEAIITPDEVAIAIMGHQPIGTENAWGRGGTREKPSGLGIVNLHTREMQIVNQIPTGSGHWHVHGSPDGRWAVGDDFARNLWLIDRATGETRLLSAGHKETAADHVHPTFSADSTRIQIQSAMLSEDGRTMNICIVPVPEDWLARARLGGSGLPDARPKDTDQYYRKK